MSAHATTLPAPAPLTPQAAWAQLHRMASERYRSGGRFAWHFARGKLGRDPVFRALLERGRIPAQARVLDIGCGQGLLASLLAACDQLAASRRWPAAWPATSSTIAAMSAPGAGWFPTPSRAVSLSTPNSAPCGLSASVTPSVKSTSVSPGAITPSCKG